LGIYQLGNLAFGRENSTWGGEDLERWTQRGAKMGPFWHRLLMVFFGITYFSQEFSCDPDTTKQNALREFGLGIYNPFFPLFAGLF